MEFRISAGNLERFNLRLRTCLRTVPEDAEDVKDVKDLIDIDASESRRVRHSTDGSVRVLLEFVSGGISDRMDCLIATAPPLPLLSAAPILTLFRGRTGAFVSSCRNIELCLVGSAREGEAQVELKSRPFARCCNRRISRSRRLAL
jgi:hypothetical protein